MTAGPPLSLRDVPAAQGARWMRDGFRLFGKKPLAFSLMLMAFWVVALLVSSLLPFGEVLVLVAVPLLGLGFMIAAESALNNGPVHPGQFITPLRGDPARRRSLLILCVAFGACTALVWWVANVVDDGTFTELNRLIAKDAPKAEIDAVMQSERLQQGLLVRLILLVLLAIPFWHAPALVHWGGQSPAQALFSSTLAMWRNRMACVVYVMSWFAIMLVFGTVTALALGLLGMRQAAVLMALPAGLFFTTVFYVSLLFTFNDTFGGSGVRAQEP